MLIGMEVANTIQCLAASNDYTFVLTGSHRFGKSHSQSDYDFMVCYGPEVNAWLEKLGFSSIPINTLGYDYMDKCIQRVVRKNNIDIQLIKAECWSKRVALVEMISKSPMMIKLLYSMVKHQRRHFWSELQAVW